MEDAKKKAFPRKLDLSLPLLSTRRFGGCTSMNSQMGLQDTSNGIPFCWEKAPGKPKNMERNETDDGETPRPRLPPCRWQPPKKENYTNDYIDVDDDDGDADIDDDNEGDVFSDAVEVLSLTEAIDIVQKAENENEDGAERLNLESVKSSERESPNFMMERFLPDATAIAAYSKHFYNNYVEEEEVGVSQSYCSQQSAHKGCGLDVLFPWRFKHKLCGARSPVRHVSPPTNLKLHKRSSTHSPFSHVIKKKDI